MLWVVRTATLSSRSLLVYYPYDSWTRPKQPQSWILFDDRRQPVIRLLGNVWNEQKLIELLAGTGTTVLNTTRIEMTTRAASMTGEQLLAMTDEEAAEAMQPIHPRVPRYPVARQARSVAWAMDHPLVVAGITFGVCLAIGILAIAIGGLVMAVSQ
jgi:hypothetical protein